MNSKLYLAEVKDDHGKFHVTVAELEHIELVASDDQTMKAQTRHWIAEMEDLDPNSFDIEFHYLNRSTVEIA